MSSSQNLVLSGRYDLSVLADLRADLLSASSGGEGAFGLDLTAVEGGDVGFVQLLLSFEKALLGGGRSLAVSASEAVADLFGQSGAALPGARA